MGISIEQSLPSRRAMSGRGCMGPLGIGPRMDTATKNKSYALAAMKNIIINFTNTNLPIQELTSFSTMKVLVLVFLTQLH